MADSPQKRKEDIHTIRIPREGADGTKTEIRITPDELDAGLREASRNRTRDVTVTAEDGARHEVSRRDIVMARRNWMKNLDEKQRAYDAARRLRGMDAPGGMDAPDPNRLRDNPDAKRHPKSGGRYMVRTPLSEKGPRKFEITGFEARLALARAQGLKDYKTVEVRDTDGKKHKAYVGELKRVRDRTLARRAEEGRGPKVQDGPKKNEYVISARKSVEERRRILKSGGSRREASAPRKVTITSDAAVAALKTKGMKDGKFVGYTVRTKEGEEIRVSRMNLEAVAARSRAREFPPAPGRLGPAAQQDAIYHDMAEQLRQMAADLAAQRGAHPSAGAAQPLGGGAMPQADPQEILDRVKQILSGAAPAPDAQKPGPGGPGQQPPAQGR